jgi:hypothetical protein
MIATARKSQAIVDVRWGNLDVCTYCLGEMYDVDEIVLAFYPELADFLNKDPDLAATAMSIELSFVELKAVLAIRQYEDYSQVPAADLLPGYVKRPTRVKVVSIQGKIDEHEQELIVFKIHVGYAPLADHQFSACQALLGSRFDSLSGGESLFDLARAKWVNLGKYDQNTGVRSTFRYNLFDQAGFQILCEWAHQQTRQWFFDWPLDRVREKGLLD